MVHVAPMAIAFASALVLSACSKAISPQVDDQAAKPQATASKDELTIDPAALASKDNAVAEPALNLASNIDLAPVQDLRPLLSIDGDAISSLPDVLPDGAEVSYIVIDLNDGAPIAEREMGRDHIPASSAKLATAVAALELLGPDHRFRTELRATGPIENGILKGDLVLKGGGDPLLDIPDLLPLIDQLKRKGLTRIEGRFLIDDRLLPRLTEIEPSQPTEAAYNPGLGALSVAFNRVNLRWKKRRGLAVETVPRLEEASFESAKRDRLPPGGVQLKQASGGSVVWQLADKGARLSKRSLPVKDAGLHAGQVFADLARLYGINLPAPERLDHDLTSGLVALRESKPLRDMVRDMLWYSNNLMAELIGLSAAKTLDPDIKSLDQSSDILLRTLGKELSDVPWTNAKLDNHSGLSSKARLTPEQLAAILRRGWDNGMLSSLLPGSGWSGTLARRFNQPDQALRVWAKTGSINYVATLGGYLLSASHSPAAFVIMISDEKARARYDAAPRRTRDSENKAQVWQRDAEEAMDQIVERWLQPASDRPSRSLHAARP
jgi:D-alanyl-D-alanine carboxypeptidase/D-alanyl-D-alanine-endopeptidase (penicillin-binding protein 4)